MEQMANVVNPVLEQMANLFKATGDKFDLVALLPCISHMKHHHGWYLKPPHGILIFSIAWQHAESCWQAAVKHKG